MQVDTIFRYLLAIVINIYLEIILSRENMYLKSYLVVLISLCGCVYSCNFDYSKITNIFDSFHGKLTNMHEDFLGLVEKAAVFIGCLTGGIVLMVFAYKIWKNYSGRNRTRPREDYGGILQQILTKGNE